MNASPARPVVRRALILLVAVLGLSLCQTPAQARDDAGRATYSPPLGATFSSPLDGNGREILSQVYRSIYASPKGSTIRLVVWNFADPAVSIEPSRLAARAGAATLLAFLNPLAAIVPFMDVGNNEDAKRGAAKCQALAQRKAGKAPVSPEAAGKVTERIKSRPTRQ